MPDGPPGLRTTTVDFILNGQPRRIEVEVRRTLADALREDCGLTGTHLGCEHGVCGACTVLLDGRSARACIVLAVQAQGRKVTTIEGLSEADGLSPLQQAMSRCGGLQCGFCTPGIVVAATELVRDAPVLDEETVRNALSGNLCRCTGYEGIVDAVLSQDRRILQAPGVAVSTPDTQDQGTGLDLPPSGPARLTWHPPETGPRHTTAHEAEKRSLPHRRRALLLGVGLALAWGIATWWRRLRD